MSKTYLLSIPIHTSMKSDLVYGADQLIDAYNANIKGIYSCFAGFGEKRKSLSF